MTPGKEFLQWLVGAMADLDTTIAAGIRAELGRPITSPADRRGNASMTIRVAFRFNAIKGRDVPMLHMKLVKFLEPLAPKLATVRVVDHGVTPILPPDMQIGRRGNGNMVNGFGSSDIDHLDYDVIIRTRPSYRKLLEVPHAAANL